MAVIGSSTHDWIRFSSAHTFFILKAKIEGHADVSFDEPRSSLLQAPPVVSSLPSVQVQPDVLANTVRIERLSDDEDVDITDDLSDEPSQPENHFDFRDESKGLNRHHNPCLCSYLALYW